MHRGGLRVRVVGLIAGLLLLGGLAWAQAPALFPPQGLTIPTTTTSLGAAAAMPSSCPAGQFLTQITATTYTCTPQALPSSGSITDSMLANPYSGVGACTSGQYVNALVRNGPPICGTPAGGGSFAPLVNPAGGQNNYAPLASPTFTGTVTMPGAGTFTTAGYNNAAGIGVGQVANAGGVAGLIGITINANDGTQHLTITNTSNGSNAQASAAFHNDVGHVAAFGTVSSTFSGVTSIPSDSFYFYSGGANGTEFVNGPSSGTAPINFWVNGTTLAGAFGTGGGAGGLTVGSPTGGDKGLGTVNVSSGYFVNGVALGGGSGTVTSVALSGGTTGLTVSGSPITTSGTMTLAGTLAIANGGTGATTAGAALTNLGAAPLASPTFTGTVTMPDASTITSTGYNSVKAMGIGTTAGTLAGNPVTLGVYGATTGVNPVIGVYNANTTDIAAAAGVSIYTGTGGSIYPTYLSASGPAWTSNPSIPASSASLLTSEPNGLFLGTNTIPNSIVFQEGGTNIAKFLNGLVMGSATGGDKGAGTINATNYYVNGTAMTGLVTAAIPLSIASGGTGASTAPTTGQIEVAQSTTAFGPVTMSGDATITSAGAITVSKTNGTSFTGLATATIPLSIANGGRGSSTAPTAGQIDVAQSGTAFGAVTMSGDATITSAGVVTNTRLNGATPGGACTGNQYVLSINSSGVPTCGSLLAPLANPTFTGTVTIPDASTITSAGYNNLVALGIGQAAGTVAGNAAMLGIYANTSGVEPSMGIWNQNTTDTAGTAGYAVYTGTGGTIYPTQLFAFGPAFTANATFPASSAALQTSEPNGIKIGTNTTPNTIGFNIASANIAQISTTGFNLQSGTYKVAGSQIATSNLADVVPGGTCTWTPSDTSGASLVFSSIAVSCTKHGNIVFIYGRLSYPSTSNAASAQVGGLPYPTANQAYVQSTIPIGAGGGSSTAIGLLPIQNSTNFQFRTIPGGTAETNAVMSGQTVLISFFYSTQ